MSNYEKTIWQSADKTKRIIEQEDPNFSMEDLKGDCFSLEYNLDEDPQKLKAEESAFENLVYADGVFGYTLETWNPEPDKGWEHLDSCWGFIGPCKFNIQSKEYSHYIIDEMIQTAKGGE